VTDPCTSAMKLTLRVPAPTVGGTNRSVNRTTGEAAPTSRRRGLIVSRPRLHALPQEVLVVKPPLYMLALPRYEEEVKRCCDDLRRVRAEARPAWPIRWTRKLGTAMPTTVRVFRRQMATPATPTIDPGTPVVSSRGRSFGVVRSLVVEVGTGGTSYAVALENGDVRVILLPRSTLHETDEVAVVDEQVARRLERLSA
jgi:hypothetical protein